MPNISDVLYTRAEEYEKRMGRRPVTLSLSHDEYYQLKRASFPYEPVMGRVSGRINMQWRGFKLRIRDYGKEYIAKEERIGRGGFLARRRTPATVMASYLQSHPDAFVFGKT